MSTLWLPLVTLVAAAIMMVLVWLLSLAKRDARIVGREHEKHVLSSLISSRA